MLIKVPTSLVGVILVLVSAVGFTTETVSKIMNVKRRKTSVINHANHHNLILVLAILI